MRLRVTQLHHSPCPSGWPIVKAPTPAVQHQTPSQSEHTCPRDSVLNTGPWTPNFQEN